MQRIYSKADQGMEDAAKVVVDAITTKLNALFAESYLVKMVQTDASSNVTLNFEKVTNDNIKITSVILPKELISLQ